MCNPHDVVQVWLKIKVIIGISRHVFVIERGEDNIDRSVSGVCLNIACMQMSNPRAVDNGPRGHSTVVINFLFYSMLLMPTIAGPTRVDIRTHINLSECTVNE